MYLSCLTKSALVPLGISDNVCPCAGAVFPDTAFPIISAAFPTTDFACCAGAACCVGAA